MMVVQYVSVSCCGAKNSCMTESLRPQTLSVPLGCPTIGTSVPGSRPMMGIVARGIIVKPLSGALPAVSSLPSAAIPGDPSPISTCSRGAQWGAGVAGVLVGDITDKLSFAGILANQWGEKDFNTMIVQPMFFYSVTPGKSIAYNAVISADWQADSDNRWTVPLGLSYNQTIDMGNGHGFDFMIGPYYNVERPQGAARWQIRFGLNWLFP